MNNDDLKHEVDQVEEMFNWHVRGPERRKITANRWVAIDWHIVWLYACIGLLAMCVGGLLL